MIGTREETESALVTAFDRAMQGGGLPADQGRRILDLFERVFGPAPDTVTDAAQLAAFAAESTVSAEVAVA